MEKDPNLFIAHFAVLSDEELLSRFGSGALTGIATEVAAREILRRGIKLPETPSLDLGAQTTAEYAGDYEIVARFLNVMDAYVVRSCLEAAGVPAMVADAHTVQTNALWAPALGGVRILVPAKHVVEAKEVIAAFDSGAFELSDEDDPA